MTSVDPSQGIVDLVRSAQETGTTEAIISALRQVDAESLSAFYRASFGPDPGMAGSTPEGADENLHADLEAMAAADELTRGTPAGGGAASGPLALSTEAALAAAERGRAAILVRTETSPEDVAGMQVAAGIVTTRGGVASHAAVVARGWGIAAVVGASQVEVFDDRIRIADTVLRPGDPISIDGATGGIFGGSRPTLRIEPPPELTTLLTWADTITAGRVTVRANADTGIDARRARDLGAAGIGLCRTEHMFLAPERLPLMQRFLRAIDPGERAGALAQLEDAQAADLEAVLEAMDGQTVTVRLLDAPLHEFVPEQLDETNPMIGTRGIRLAVVRSGLYQMQVRALQRAIVSLRQRGCRPVAEIMVPLVVDAAELRLARSWITETLSGTDADQDTTVPPIGVMIETPRAALTATALAGSADFFSLGTNDLTQLAFGLSRDDVEAELVPAYLDQDLLDDSPFVALDQAGVGSLLAMAIEGANAVDPALPVGACGEHAGHPASIRFLLELGADSISCSPLRVPVARLAAAQSVLDRPDFDSDGLTFDSVPTQPRPTTTSTFAADADAASAETDAPTLPDEALVLYVLRLRGFATADGLRASLGDLPDGLLHRLLDEGLVRHIESRELYGLLPAGRDRQQELFGSLTSPQLRARLEAPYRAQFLPLNVELKELCSRWQVRNGQPNEHTDAAYDRSCIDHLVDLADRIGLVLANFVDVVPRFRRYRTRLSEAAQATADGDTKRFTGVMNESFHDIWMELHEDLIHLLGIDRAEEGSY